MSVIPEPTQPKKRKQIRNLVNLAYHFGVGEIDYFESEPTPTRKQMRHWHNSHVDEVTDRIMKIANIKAVDDV